MKTEKLYKAIKSRKKKINFFTKYYEIKAQLKSTKNDFHKKEKMELTFLMIFNRKSFQMVRACLFSFLSSSLLIPQKIVLVSDGTWIKEDGQNYFSSFKSLNIIYESWENSANYHRDKGREDFYNYACKQIWGKKLACILKYSELGLTLFSDPDVLWYNIPDQLKSENNSELFLMCQQGENLSYDKVLIDKMNVDFLKEKPLVNAGIVLIKGNFFEKSEFLDSAIKHESESPGDFSEQTILALLVNEFGAVFPYTVVKSDIKELLGNLTKKRTYPKEFCARHYVWLMKVLYWNDFIHHF